mmetsp:Transcript_32887/g.75231  ORF Transcript_32887/g.75231 Transcript_32887/m.75231 type:complete len:127 (-) Transcript_32887:1612-1992(-)
MIVFLRTRRCSPMAFSRISLCSKADRRMLERVCVCGLGSVHEWLRMRAQSSQGENVTCRHHESFGYFWRAGESHEPQTTPSVASLTGHRPHGGGLGSVHETLVADDGAIHSGWERRLPPRIFRVVR